MTKQPQSRGRKQKEPSGQELLKDPKAAADQIDAILYFLHRRYAGDDMLTDLPSMRSFLVDKMEVVFTDSVTRIIIEKRPERNTLSILAPPVPKEEEEERRLFLLSEFGELLIRSQKEGYLQVRDMLLAILDEQGKLALINEYKKYRLQHTGKKK